MVFVRIGGLAGEVEDYADTDRLEEVGSGLVRDAGDAADAELDDANIHQGENLEGEAGEALVGDAMVDADAAVLEGEGSVEAGIRCVAAVSAG